MENLPQVLPPAPSQEEVIRLLERYPLPVDANGVPLVFAYGTAGFRYDATLLEGIMVRVGMLAAYRSFGTKQHVGVMVTASHNDESYNGVKLADPHGGMMAQDGELLAVQLANCSDAHQVYGMVAAAAAGGTGTTAMIHVGRDTRSHSPALTMLTIRAAQAMGATVLFHGIVTTPILHHAVMHANPHHLPPLIPVRTNVIGYYSLLAHSYIGLCRTAVVTNNNNSSSNSSNILPRMLVVDCACGVGYAHVQRMNQELMQLGATTTLVPKNAPDEGPLNAGCGSEHVQKGICPPTWYAEEEIQPIYAASVDGDADRIVFFTQQSNNSNNGPSSFSLLDGDKIAVLLCDFLQDLVVELQTAAPSLPPLRLGVVQTAYANGASTQYLISKLGPDGVKFAKTGVKFVHHAALHYFDVGVYFEANGHGTVLFGNAFYEFMAAADKLVRGHVALQRLALLPSLINQSVGDALSDLLLVDAILQLKNWDIHTWDALYKDMPSRQCKVKVQDRSVIVTNENETRCVAPVALQDALDAVVATLPGAARAFVRPSGTENVVRVYAEAATPEDADWLATEAARLVHELCDGTDVPPSFGGSTRSGVEGEGSSTPSKL
jgi:phosphoacetylglucosamine mutase